MAPLLHFFSEGVLGEAHADRSHHGCRFAGFDHVIAPAVHATLPLVNEAVGDDLGQVVLDLVWSIADRPEEPPLGIEVLRVHGEWLVRLWQAIGQLLMVACLFHGLGRDASLVAELGAHVDQLTARVVLRCNAFEVPLDHVDVVLVVLMVDAGVANDANAELVEAVSDFLALLLPLAILCLEEECLHIDNGRLNQVFKLRQARFDLLGGARLLRLCLCLHIVCVYMCGVVCLC